MSRKPIVRMAELEIDPDTLEAYRALLTEEIEASLALEDGVLSLSAVSIRDSPNRIRILEVYADQEAYEAHLRTPHFLKYKNQTAQMVTSLTLIEVDPIAMRAKP
ncbi:putative quinol monooxygenase [Rhizobium leguminosarum]|uniref:Antibiotic biosynthesis monooxygenase family protein n=1 Tax=Rhizobium leguminosarum TaxID=384 RepID=A0A2Z4YLQ6_RHILE|nr:putative quinol monooxygenase [Rhizobium leguminosarum]AXA41332.1 Antibiotic biosynthesis monooxygenase family protein [Rhizobium leguminosarum]MBB4390783.1 quinol monooxygenase YgiN [Rhizobium leguminosarum]MBB4587517.1 quinol monooxygenase YgiN [Rhizobium leguminosarum]RWX27790.1 antibiotic biosynthesis monooxygenase [Rhizobium leguminosarum]TCA01535.1 antibiotic biosynthesis monooxygenase [Rhizobium leguminosarum bv. viciae]